ncbi:type III-A CRISPR-associated RAMP protein Csm4 [Deinococcus sp. Arct2-2]|uniref:type III-A CRISPR-associated RAMP protein Csm4 n=1 Tax=Deinococcus sp. Arct2-2 TaxID=2568653 RepID=UPI001454BF81|nr:type III-A CRISPR-associated RAMP protein Csm4 [Deinococcus sp. Arct2-2]
MGHHDLVVLTFRDPLRGRDLRPGHLPSDLLWGALYAADVRLQGTPLPTDNPYRVSSAFPFVGGEWLLPKPRASAHQGTGDRGSEPSDKKAVKRLEFVNLSDFVTLSSGQRLSPERLQAAAARQRRALLPVSAETLPLTVTPEHLARSLRGTKHAGRSAQWAGEQYAAQEKDLTPTERLHLSREARGRSVTGQAERQRNTQDRITQSTTTFLTAQVMPPRLAFLLETSDEGQRTRLIAALRLLTDSGLGGMRTQGSGQFAFELQPLSTELKQRLGQGGPQVLLGLARPSADEAEQIDQAEQASYTLVRRDGFLDGTPLQRQDVWLLAEGSLVPAPLNGTLADVSPPGHPHPVWRSGLAVSLGVGG